MKTTVHDEKILTVRPAETQRGRKLPHERDESPEAGPIHPQEVMRQAAVDVKRGLVDTDLHDAPQFNKKNNTPSPFLESGSRKTPKK